MQVRVGQAKGSGPHSLSTWPCPHAGGLYFRLNAPSLQVGPPSAKRAPAASQAPADAAKLARASTGATAAAGAAGQRAVGVAEAADGGRGGGAPLGAPRAALLQLLLTHFVHSTATRAQLDVAQVGGVSGFLRSAN